MSRLWPAIALALAAAAPAGATTVDALIASATDGGTLRGILSGDLDGGLVVKDGLFTIYLDGRTLTGTASGATLDVTGGTGRCAGAKGRLTTARGHVTGSFSCTAVVPARGGPAPRAHSFAATVRGTWLRPRQLVAADVRGFGAAPGFMWIEKPIDRSGRWHFEYFDRFGAIRGSFGRGAAQVAGTRDYASAYALGRFTLTRLPNGTLRGRVYR